MPHHFSRLQIPRLLSHLSVSVIHAQLWHSMYLSADVARSQTALRNLLKMKSFFLFLRSVQLQLSLLLSLSDDNSLLSSSVCPHKYKSLTSLDSYPPVAPAKSRSDPEQTHTHLCIPTAHLFCCIPAVLFTVRRLDFHGFLACLCCCLLLPAALFQHGPDLLLQRDFPLEADRDARHMKSSHCLASFWHL